MDTNLGIISKHSSINFVLLMWVLLRSVDPLIFKSFSVLLSISSCATLLLQVKLGRLPLNAHAKDKLLRLVGERYNPENDVLTIMTDRCPLRQQNLDYALYLLTTLFYESWVSVPHLFYLAPMLLIPSSTVCGFFQFWLYSHLLNRLSMFLYYCSHHHRCQLGIN